MHAGWPFLENMIARLQRVLQVYVDVGVIDWTKPRKEFDRYLRGLVEAGYGRRILFGSDQMVWPEAIEMAVAAIQSAEYLSPDQSATSSTTTRRGSFGWSRTRRWRPRAPWRRCPARPVHLQAAEREHVRGRAQDPSSDTARRRTQTSCRESVSPYWSEGFHGPPRCHRPVRLPMICTGLLQSAILAVGDLA